MGPVHGSRCSRILENGALDPKLHLSSAVPFHSSEGQFVSAVSTRQERILDCPIEVTLHSLFYKIGIFSGASISACTAYNYFLLKGIEFLCTKDFVSFFS